MAVARLPGERRQWGPTDIGPGAIHSEHITPAAILSGHVSNDYIKIVDISGISVSAKGCQHQAIGFSTPFPHACNGVFLQIKEFRNAAAYIDCPSGLKVMVWPSKRRQYPSGFQLNVDVNISCSVPNVNMAVACLCFGN